MRREKLKLYVNTTDEIIEEEVVVYGRDELIALMKNGDLDVSMYLLDVFTPWCSLCSVEALAALDPSDEFYINEHDKLVVLYGIY